jgi:hypothetical protein
MWRADGHASQKKCVIENDMAAVNSIWYKLLQVFNLVARDIAQ